MRLLQHQKSCASCSLPENWWLWKVCESFLTRRVSPSAQRMPFEHWRRGWMETKITERSCWLWRWVEAGWNASEEQIPFLWSLCFFFLGLSWMCTLFALTVTALPFSFQLPPRSLNGSYWKLCITFTWLNWFLLLSGLLPTPSTDWGKLSSPNGSVPFGAFSSASIPVCPTVSPPQDNSCGHISKWWWWTRRIFSFLSSWRAVSLVSGSL